MTTPWFSSARLLVDAGFTVPIVVSVRRRPLAPEPLRTAVRAVMQLVETVLAEDEHPEIYRDVLRQLDVAQDQVDRLPEGEAETRHLERILDALPLAGEPPEALRVCLVAYEAFLSREARLAEALRVLLLGARAYGSAMPAAEFAAYALRAGRLNRLLARWDRTAACFTAAADAGRLLDDETVLLRSRLGRGSVYQGQDELAAARATTELVLREADRLGLADVQVRAYGELAVVLRLQGACAEGVQAAYAAFQLARDAGERLQSLRDVGLSLAAVGAYDESRSALAAIHTSKHGRDDRLLGTSALIGLMSIESAVGNRVAFERWRNEAAAAQERMPPGMAVAHQLKLGLGLARFGLRRRAHVMLDDALRIARANRLRGWCREIEDRRELVALAG